MIAIQRKLDLLLTQLTEHEATQMGAARCYFVPMSRHTAEVIVINSSGFGEGDRKILNQLASRAQQLMEEELGVIRKERIEEAPKEKRGILQKGGGVP